MGALRGCRSALLRFGILLTLLVTIISAADAAPSVRRTEFKNQPYELTYFADSKTILLCDQAAGNVWISEDEGSGWSIVKTIDEPVVFKVFMHPNNNQIAIALSKGVRHWITRDQGKSWNRFQSDLPPALTLQPLSFHASDPDRIILNMRDWHSGGSIYTKDGFATSDFLREGTIRCMWAHEHELFSTGDPTTDRDRTICLVQGKYSNKQTAWRLVKSDNFFDETEEECIQGDGGQPVTGIASAVAVKGYILAAQNSEGTDEMALYVTLNTNEWHRAQFGQHQVKENGYTIMESTNYSLQVDVASAGHSMYPMGNLFTSNFAGQYFTRSEDYTNRNVMGFVDFEKVANVQGIALTNVVTNWESVLEDGVEKRVATKITFDDGRDYHDIMVTEPGKNEPSKLHLHSITDQRNAGRVYSSQGSPGLMMGVGNTGESLSDYSEGNLYVSDNAGATWKRGLVGPHKYEFGDQGSILLAIYDKVEIAKMIYSLDHGKTWTQFFFKDYDFPEQVRAQMLTTIPDSTSLKFLLLATTGAGADQRHWVYTIDFAGLHERKCNTDDFETFYARVDADGKPTCVMGHKQSYSRRKATADCFVDEEFKDPAPTFDNAGCLCTVNDFECDFMYVRSPDRTQCVPLNPIGAPEGECTSPEGTFVGPSGFRKIPGNECILEGGIDKAKPIERPCKDSYKAPVSGDISREITYFPADAFREYYYLERSASSSGDDETVVLLTDDRQVYVSHDHGKTWGIPPHLEEVEVLSIYPNRHLNDAVYFLTGGTDVYYSKNRAYDVHSFYAPGRPNTAHLQILRFHPKNADWLIWTTCADGGGLQCQPMAYWTTHNGDSWNPLLRSIENCEFVWRDGRDVNEQLIYCTQFANEDATGAKQLVASEDWYDHKVVHFTDMLNFATMSEFIVVAAKDAEDAAFLKVDASTDGKTFADARFPVNFQVPHQTAYTVLDSSTHSIFLHVTVNGVMEQEYGSIIKSNTNGTSYVMSLNGVNRNQNGYVDFEKMLGLEGVAVVNVVSNIEDVERGQSKILKTMITHNDGAEWALIKPPKYDASGKEACKDQPIEECALHLHGYTERKDPRDTYSSPAAIGLMMGVGNVGASLGRKREGDTYISSDGGLSWQLAKQGVYMWEFGDHGGIIVMIEEYNPTRFVYYSRDSGKTWTEYQFSDTDFAIDDITTVPSDTSRNFLIWGRELSGMGRAVTVALDFSGFTDRQCELGNPGTSTSDFELWEPQHPTSQAAGRGNCFFGHVAQYSRKKPTADCYVGAQEFNKLYSIAENCTCTRSDYECDYNFERTSAGDCKLVDGQTPKNPEEVCRAHPEIDEFFDVSGYRKLPLSTCEGGNEFDIAVESHPCPGHEEQYQKKRGISGVALFFAIFLPIAAAAVVGYFAWRQIESRYGRIRLGESGPSAGGGRSAFDAENVWVRIPVLVVSGIAAVVMAIPAVFGGLIRVVRERTGRGGDGGGGRGRGGYTSRGAFARARGRDQDYSSVVSEDEDGDLLGADLSDDDV